MTTPTKLTKPAPKRPGAAATKPAATTAKPAPAKAGPKAEPLTDQAAETETAELTPEQKAAAKEEKKKAAFAKLRERAEAKRAENTVARQEQMSELKGTFEVGQHKFLTRASYYGCEVAILGFEEVRGRNLVIVQVLTSKKGKRLPEERLPSMIRRVDPKFLEDERPEAAYTRRRESPTADDVEAEIDDSVEAEAELEAEVDDESEVSDDGDSDEDGDESEDGATDSEEEDTW